MLLTLADAWGFMIFGEGLFNADFHPGNILIMPEVRLIIILRLKMITNHGCSSSGKFSEYKM